MGRSVLTAVGMCPVTATRVNAITEQVIGAAIRVHRALGPGLLESVYLACLLHELRGIGVSVVTQFPVPVRSLDVRLDCGYRVDAIIEDLVIVEVKAVAQLAPIHEAQLLRTSLYRAGQWDSLSLHTKLLTHGIRRVGEPTAGRVGAAPRIGGETGSRGRLHAETAVLAEVLTAQSVADWCAPSGRGWLAAATPPQR